MQKVHVNTYLKKKTKQKAPKATQIKSIKTFAVETGLQLFKSVPTVLKTA